VLYGEIQRLGPITQADLLARTGYPINVITARVRALVLKGEVRADGFDIGPSGAKRTRWRATTASERDDARRQQTQLEVTGDHTSPRGV
jgi:hypothetical protein